ncbi:hypothetical protein LQF12_08100 [Ruania suaedae]|uniref:hypothetical protein n=1 Tax=Ruania suaedae TaxID=2897774 RepID=UPI001E302DE8|nr:hypothetical protein [Ruania suaedae]UFU04517.1 hypothetical protein LQF12_08100 [Ruania suaedae]
MTVLEQASVPAPIASGGAPAMAASVRGLARTVTAGALIIALDSLFSPAAAMHQWALAGHSVALWVVAPALVSAAVVAGVSAHRGSAVTPLHSSLLFGAATTAWMMLGVSNVEGTLYGLVLGAGAVAAGHRFGNEGASRRALTSAAIVVAATACLLNVAVPALSPAIGSALSGAGLPLP